MRLQLFWLYYVEYKLITLITNYYNFLLLVVIIIIEYYSSICFKQTKPYFNNSESKFYWNNSFVYLFARFQYLYVISQLSAHFTKPHKYKRDLRS